MRSTLLTFTKQTIGRVPSPDLDEQAFDDVRGAQLTPQMAREAEERQQLRQVFLQLPYHRRIVVAPPPTEAVERLPRLSPTLGPVDRLGALFDFLVVALANLLENVAHLVHPTPLMQRPRIDGLDRCRQARTAVGYNQSQVPALQAAPVEILQ